MASRVTAISWWFFSLMILTLYTASLTSMLTVNKASLPIEKIEDLLNFDGLTYGIQPGGATQYAFEHSDYEPFQKMWAEMIKERKFYRGSLGVDEVRVNKDFAFINELPYMQYDTTVGPCNLKLVTNTNTPRSGYGYGFAFPKDSDLFKNFSVGLLDMFADGSMADIHQKWFYTRSQCSEENNVASTVETLTFDDVQGVFLTFIGGLAVSFLFFGINSLNLYRIKKCRKSQE